MQLQYSFIIPVYNRPDEIQELLESFEALKGDIPFEIVIVEDGSTKTSKEIVDTFNDKLNISYFFKENSGPGDSRNFGMQHAQGNYFIILDSDVIVPKEYLSEVKKALKNNFTDAFGGPDAAHKSFTSLQKAINYSMTSVLTTGGIRGKKQAIGKFQPRSFNLGLSKDAFEKTNGFSDLKNGEDIDLTFRLWKHHFKTQLIEKAFVYHKRRSNIQQFFKQTFGFGTARPLLNKRFPDTSKITYWFPSIFIIGLDISLVLAVFGYQQFLYFYAFYFLMLFIDSLYQNKNLYVAFLSIFTTLTQFLGYGLGFLQSQFYPNKKK